MPALLMRMSIGADRRSRSRRRHLAPSLLGHVEDGAMDHVSLGRQASAARVDLVGAAAVDDDFGAMLRQPFRQRQADPLARTGDQRPPCRSRSNNELLQMTPPEECL